MSERKADLAKEYGVVPTTIGDVIAGRTWSVPRQKKPPAQERGA